MSVPFTGQNPDDRARPRPTYPPRRTTVRCPGARALNGPDVIPAGHRGVTGTGVATNGYARSAGRVTSRRPMVRNRRRVRQFKSPRYTSRPRRDGRYRSKTRPTLTGVYFV